MSPQDPQKRRGGFVRKDTNGKPLLTIEALGEGVLIAPGIKYVAITA